MIIAALASRITIQSLSLGSAHWRRSFIDFRLDKAVDITIFVWSILFVVWFRRARINAEHHGYRQRRARVWAFQGWIIPVVSLWFPFQIMGDIWRAGLPASDRRKIAWLPALWWTCWLLSGLSFGARAMSANSGPIPHIAANTPAVSLGLLAICGSTLIAIIHTVTDGPVGSPLSDAPSSDEMRSLTRQPPIPGAFGDPGIAAWPASPGQVPDFQKRTVWWTDLRPSGRTRW